MFSICSAKQAKCQLSSFGPRQNSFPHGLRGPKKLKNPFMQDLMNIWETIISSKQTLLVACMSLTLVLSWTKQKENRLRYKSLWMSQNPRQRNQLLSLSVAFGHSPTSSAMFSWPLLIFLSNSNETRPAWIFRKRAKVHCRNRMVSTLGPSSKCCRKIFSEKLQFLSVARSAKTKESLTFQTSLGPWLTFVSRNAEVHKMTALMNDWMRMTNERCLDMSMTNSLIFTWHSMQS